MNFSMLPQLPGALCPVRGTSTPLGSRNSPSSTENRFPILSVDVSFTLPHEPFSHRNHVLGSPTIGLLKWDVKKGHFVVLARFAVCARVPPRATLRDLGKFPARCARRCEAAHSRGISGFGETLSHPASFHSIFTSGGAIFVARTTKRFVKHLRQESSEPCPFSTEIARIVPCPSSNRCGSVKSATASPQLSHFNERLTEARSKQAR